MGLLDAPYCPNVKCSQEGLNRKQSKCPKCGVRAKQYGINDAALLMKQKRFYQIAKPTIEQ
jgi:hypothetical protein